MDGGINTYVYSNLNPVIYYDERGLKSITRLLFPFLFPSRPKPGLGSDSTSYDIELERFDSEECEDDDCKDRLSDWQLNNFGLDAHEIKRDFLGKRAKISLYELYRCKDNTIAIRLIGCKGPTIRTGIRL